MLKNWMNKNFQESRNQEQEIKKNKPTSILARIQELTRTGIESVICKGNWKENNKT